MTTWTITDAASDVSASPVFPSVTSGHSSNAFVFASFTVTPGDQERSVAAASPENNAWIAALPAPVPVTTTQAVWLHDYEGIEKLRNEGFEFDPAAPKNG